MFQERLKKIKEQRIASEQLLLESNIQKFVNFDIEKRLEENEETAEKSLKSHKSGAYLAGAYLLGAVGTVAFGASIVATGGVFAGAMIMGGVTTVTVPFLPELLDSASFIFKDVKSHNLDLVQNELSQLKKTVEESAVNQKTTVTDYFKAAKETLKSSFSKLKNEIKNDCENIFKPLSQEKILDRIKQMKDSKQDFINSSKLKM